MTKLHEIYRCPVCGNIVEVMNVGAGTLVCCGKPMLLLVENTTDAAHEKHVPVVVAVDNGYLVKVGSTEHPMMDSHYIQWIELLTEKAVYRKELKPGDKPEVFFETHEKIVAAREYCNLHGLWRGELQPVW